ncbi:hypothetical protein CCM_02794 [Cordyceps militaris CM01]|uniref:Uncharacterized protein n=1 Tax=Cordyceps militaris (strain CM01) TaxID=983644 RepID=G3JBV0_CORMM|nr:uncharacterized protein CCM_02794 [Cordyceps militaris CM01]EGX94523.1 hypothetical protein CCM_02794 [Cordyceps militaris CM01]
MPEAAGQGMSFFWSRDTLRILIRLFRITSAMKRGRPVAVVNDMEPDAQAIIDLCPSDSTTPAPNSSATDSSPCADASPGPDSREESPLAIHKGLSLAVQQLSRLGWQFEPLWEDESTMYFIDQYCIPPSPGLFPGFLNFLTDLVATSPPGSALSRASLASSCLSLARHTKSPCLYRKACRHYGAALSALSTTLNEPAAAWKDDTIAVIMLLNLFEASSSCQRAQASGGQTADMGPRKRGRRISMGSAKSSLPGQRTSRKLVRAVRCIDGPCHTWHVTAARLPPGPSRLANRQQQMETLKRGETFDCITLGEDTGDTSTLSTGMAAALCWAVEFCIETARCVRNMDVEPISADKQAESLRSAIDRARRIQLRFETLVRGFDRSLKPMMARAKDGRPVMICLTRLLGIMWMGFDTVLVLFYSTVLSCSRRILELPNCLLTDSERDLVTKTSAMTEKNIILLLKRICASIPYNMGDVDEQGQHMAVPRPKAASSYYLTWFLAVVTNTSQVNEAQLRECYETQDKIFTMYGLNTNNSAMMVTTMMSFFR